MKKNIKSTTNVIFFSLCFLLCFSSCQRRDKTLTNQNTSKKSKIDIPKIKKATFFLENSGSMLGYVDGSGGITQFVEVISELAEKPDFVSQKTILDFNFINGKDLYITPLGNDPSVLKKKLNVTGYNCGSVQNSNLNAMFQKALSIAGGENISILISDGIYDVGDQQNPFSELSVESKETRSKYIQRLQQSDIQTLLIKLNSQFKGNYCFASKKDSKFINHSRPYYIWIFGESDLLNKYFSDQYISDNLKGYEDLARFLKIGDIEIPYKVIPDNLPGTYQPDHRVKNKLNHAEPDRNGRGFQIYLAVDFSNVPFSNSYLENIDNYEPNNDYSIVQIQKPVKKIHEADFTPTHIITLKANKNPYGSLEVNLKNSLPPWIKSTNADDENMISTDNRHTYGFKYLTEAISEAYQYNSNNRYVASFKIEILK